MIIEGKRKQERETKAREGNDDWLAKSDEEEIDNGFDKAKVKPQI